jgi:hypothetical protein
MKFHDAARRQYLHSSIYTVWLVGPGGTREELGTTQRKTCVGLMGILYLPGVQARIKRLPGAGDMGVRKRDGGLEFTAAGGEPNGWRVEFGGTIRQEAE